MQKQKLPAQYVPSLAEHGLDWIDPSAAVLLRYERCEWMLLSEQEIPYLYILVSGKLKVLWAYTMKMSQGFSRPAYSTVTIVAMIASFWLLARVMRVLPLGTAYVIWTGIGAVGAFVLGITVLGESADTMRMVAAVLIVAGPVLMKLGSSH